MFENFLSYRPSRREYERLHHEMNHLLEQATRPTLHAASTYPAMNAWINDDGALVTAELPGLDAEALEITVRENVLTVSGHREAMQCAAGERYHRRDRGCGAFERSFQLPFNVEVDGVEATYDKGILRIWLPKAEADKPRKIKIHTA